MAKIELTSEEMGLITRALSDSMNYKPDDRFSEKWALLLTLTQKKLELEEEEKHRLDRPKRCPHHEAALWILSLMAAALFLSCFLLCGLYLVAFVYDALFEYNITGWIIASAHSHPHIAIIAGLAVYLFWLVRLAKKVPKRTQDEA